MIGYTATPDFYNDYIKHERSHKYIDKHMGKSGKWIYVYNKTKQGTNKFRDKSGWDSSYEYSPSTSSKIKRDANVIKKHNSSSSRKIRRAETSKKYKAGNARAKQNLNLWKKKTSPSTKKVKQLRSNYVAEGKRLDDRLKKSPKQWSARDWLHFVNKFL